jgi:glycosyltransferase 2 family protein
MRRKFLFGTALAAVLLGLFLYNTDFAELRDALSGVRLWPLLLACAVQAYTFHLRALRWRLLLGARGAHVPVASLFNVAAIGFMLNNFVPRGAGELARSYLLGRGRGTGFSTTFATIVLERIFDFLTVLIILAVLLSSFELPVASEGPLAGDRLRYVGWVVSAGTLGLVAFLTLLYARSAFVLGLVGRLLRPLPERLSAPVLRLMGTFIEGLSSLTSVRALAGVLLYSALVWLLLLATFPMVLGAFPAELPPSAPVLLLVLSVFSMFIPSPGGVGTMHLFVQEGLKLYGVAPAMGKAMAILLHASGYIPVTLLGLACLRLEGLHLGQLGQAEQGAEEELGLDPGPPASEPTR